MYTPHLLEAQNGQSFVGSRREACKWMVPRLCTNEQKPIVSL